MTEQRLLRSLIKRARDQRGMTQTEMADEFNVTRNTVTRWEMGAHLPTGKRYKQLIRWIADSGEAHEFQPAA